MTTQVVLTLDGEIEQAVWTWAALSDADVDEVLLTALYVLTKPWGEGLPQSIRELREQAHELLRG